jgi:Pretoxin HINT domain
VSHVRSDPPFGCNSRVRRLRAFLRIASLVLVVIGILVAAMAVGPASTASERRSSSRLKPVSVSETRVGVAADLAPVFVGSQWPGNPIAVGESCPRFDGIVSGSCVATKTRVPCASFRADTLILMADGTKKPIGEVEVGDKVVATDPVTGKKSIREVTRLFTHIDDDLLDLVVLTDDGVETIHTTDHHRFWNDTRKAWVEANDLQSGERLLTADGDPVTIGQLNRVPGAAPMLDLTIEYDYTFYVALNGTAVLVHNQTCGIVDDVIAETNAGAKNLTSKYVLTADEALSAGQKWVGPGYTEIGKPGSGVFQSSDGLRRFRIDSGSLAGSHNPGVPHVHLETVSPSNVVTTNNHIPFTN